jgi:hypothetical protein
MNQNNFGGAVIPAMAGFLFWKQAKVQEIQEIAPKQLPAVMKNQASGPTGVAKYLIALPLVTSVTKYLKNQEKQSVTGVAKYVLRQTIADRNAPPTTGVTKYLAKAAKQPAPLKKSGVAKYLAKQELAAPNLLALTGVARYEAEQGLIAKKKAMAVMVQKYKEADIGAAKAARDAAETAYESSRLTEELQYGQALEAPAATRLGRYIQEQAELLKKRPKTTSVSRYINKKIILDSQKPTVTLSKVGKYLKEQELVQSKKPNLTGVAKYLAKQTTAVRAVVPKENLTQKSGVARYLAGQTVAESNKPALSGVTKYLEKQARLEQLNKVTLRLPDHSSVKSLEGEFIPANSFAPATGVSRYLERQGAVVTVAKESLTGVSRYLEKQVGSVKQTLSSAPTGVDRYLFNRV